MMNILLNKIDIGVVDSLSMSYIKVQGSCMRTRTRTHAHPHVVLISVPVSLHVLFLRPLHCYYKELLARGI